MYLLRENNHGELAVVENPYRAVEWLWREQWLDATTECYIPGKKDFIPLFERLGFDSPKKVNHVSLVENYFLSMELEEFFEEMENFGFYFEEIDVIK